MITCLICSTKNPWLISSSIEPCSFHLGARGSLHHLRLLDWNKECQCCVSSVFKWGFKSGADNNRFLRGSWQPSGMQAGCVTGREGTGVNVNVDVRGVVTPSSFQLWLYSAHQLVTHSPEPQQRLTTSTPSQSKETGAEDRFTSHSHGFQPPGLNRARFCAGV